MTIDKLGLDWARIDPITISQIKHKNTRGFLQSLNNTERPINTHVYLCSDYRNEILRSLLSQIPGVAVYNNAGNVIYNPFDKPTIVIAHGCEGDSSCGAVSYVKKHNSDKSPEYESFVKLVYPEPIENARMQLQVVDEKNRAGVLYFDHEKGRMTNASKQNYKRLGSSLHILVELENCLEEWYTRTDIEEFAKGQDPEIIFLSNIHSPPVGFRAFQIDLQRNSFEGIIRDSFHYAMSHALRSGPSFNNTSSAVIAFRIGRGLPEGLELFLKSYDKNLIQDYIGRGGYLYFAMVGDIPSQKRLFQLKPN